MVGHSVGRGAREAGEDIDTSRNITRARQPGHSQQCGTSCMPLGERSPDLLEQAEFVTGA